MTTTTNDHKTKERVGATEQGMECQETILRCPAQQGEIIDLWAYKLKCVAQDNPVLARKMARQMCQVLEGLEVEPLEAA